MFLYHHLLSWILSLLALITCETTDVIPINFVSVIVGNNFLTGYESTSAAYDVALDKAREMYPRIFRNFTRTKYIKLGNFTCTQAGEQMIVLLSSLYNDAVANRELNVPNVVLSPGCSLEIINLGDFCREFDVPVIASTAADHTFANKERFPNVIAMGPAGYFTMCEALLALLERYSWTSMSVICDARTSDALNFGPLLFCKTAREIFTLRAQTIDVLFLSMDSSIDSQFRFSLILDVAKKHSAVTMLAAPPDVQAQLMALAVDFEMDNENYIFFLLGTPELSFNYENLWTFQDPLILKAVRVLPYSVQLSTIPPKKDDVRSAVAAMNARLSGFYKQKISPELEFNFNQIAAYQSVLAVAQVLNKFYELLPYMNGATIAHLFHNKTFEISPQQWLNISDHGMRISDIILSQYHFNRSDFFAIYYYNATSATLTCRPLKSEQRCNFKRSFPRSSDPPCGRDGRSCLFKGLTDYRMFALVLLGLGAVMGILVLIIRNDLLKKRIIWWQIDDTDLVRSNSGKRPFYLAGREANSSSCRGLDERVIEEVEYKGQVMTATEFTNSTTLHDILRNKKGLSLLKMMKDLDHPNIAKFYGMTFRQHYLQNQFRAILTEFGAKGLLRDLIDNEMLSFNWDLRFSMIWDLINGLRYLHRSSSLGAHGLLNFTNCIIDQHFTLKLTRCGLRRMYTSMLGVSFAHQIPAVCFLWLPPESLLNMEETPKISGDMYGFGVILYELITRKAPFDVDITDKTSIYDMLEIIRTDRLDTTVYLDPEEHPPTIVTMVRSCWSWNPSDRPSIRHVTNVLLKVHPQNNSTFTENIILRLQHYNEELETVIGARTQGLQEERAKVDSLLSLVLPQCIAVKLRNKIVVEPAYFEAVSVLFSDIPAFNDMVAKCSPFAIVDLLHRLYSSLDAAISPYDVFKVETIKDSYMVSSGLPNPNGNRHVTEIARTAIMMLNSGAQIESPTGYHIEFLRLRIGIHSGPCVGAVIGQKLPHYCLVGDTVNTASRMETNGAECKIHISSQTKMLLDMIDLTKFVTEERGLIEIKGKGQLRTHWLLRENT